MEEQVAACAYYADWELSGVLGCLVEVVVVLVLEFEEDGACWVFVEAVGEVGGWGWFEFAGYWGTLINRSHTLAPHLLLVQLVIVPVCRQASQLVLILELGQRDLDGQTDV